VEFAVKAREGESALTGSDKLIGVVAIEDNII